MSLALLAQIIGLVGDATTFAGALTLAIRESREGARTRQILGAKEAIEQYPEVKKINIDIAGMIIEKESDVELAITRRASKTALWGAWLLVGGFVLIGFARILEIASIP